jgi:hypothetical protein
MYSLVSAIASAIVNALLVLLAGMWWWLGIILFFVGWVVIWLLARAGSGDSLGDIGDAFFDVGGDGGGGGWGGDGGGGGCGSGGGGGD